ncbi:tetratricopeptide repeat protein [Oleiagrimonas sp.]|uniref:tetratricopeptide repeat protein n=1 Tax=Oleiagrimonas sp. TaxID=2010330 RepID=UPI00260BC4E2|nr:tetratricopeptide repeat protein [Oleiagrimonas sp.]MDA3915265.1 tetratricopeptide repeat protein [Oleiagrimonas sp.]
MTDLWQRLKQRKLVQWALAYVAAAFALLQAVDIFAQQFGWPGAVRRGISIVLVLGFFVTLVLAWYHGERGAQKVTGMELLIVTLLLALGGGFLWHFARSPIGSIASKPLMTGAPGKAASQAAPGVEQPPAVATTAILSKSIAVLPFENLSSDKDNAYFSSGMQDLILTKLADIGDLKVISRTSTLSYGSHPQNLKIVGQQLGVATLLEGSVQKAGNQVLINVQLIDAKSDSHIWAESYTRDLTNIFGVEGDVAGKIATALKARLSPAETATLAALPTRNRAAYDLFLRAEYQANQASITYATASMKAAIPLYRQAIQQDPDFAQAYARLSYIESALAWLGGGGEDVNQLNQHARADAERALQLQPDLPAAQLAVGYCDYYGRGHYAAALQAFAAALVLKPNDADALEAQGYVERRQGRFDAAIASMEKAMMLDPRNIALYAPLGETYMDVSRYADAENTFQRALALDPDNRTAKSTYALAILNSTGDIPRALAAVQGDDPRLKATRVGLLTLQHKYPQALALLQGIADIPDNFSYSHASSVFYSKALAEADLYRLMGDATHARALYAQALPTTHTQLGVRQGVALSLVWQAIANIELGLGHTAPGLDAAAKAQAIVDKTGDLLSATGVMLTNAKLYARAHRPDLAVPLLDKALVTPGIGYYYSPLLLRFDPSWDPIRNEPRFQALLKKYADATPATASIEVKP